MLKITADIFSGRDNPSWVVSDSAEISAALSEVTKVSNLMATQSAPEGKLGELRGFYVDVASDHLAADHGLDSALYLPYEPGSTGPMRNLAERFVNLAAEESLSVGMAAEGLEAAETLSPELLRSFLGQKLGKETGTSEADASPAAAAAESDEMSVEAAAAVTCMVEYAAYNPGFWNNNANVRTRNNCYNYASNKRTDTFAQPGRGCGRMYTAINCAEVSRAALCDRLHRRFVCFPDSEKPRYLVALVIAPGPGFNDFHWYRRNSEGFWSHKPGGTAARNTDNSGRVITNPETCNRGPYTQFCGYFYTCRSQLIR
jgi:hypothetical protein